MMVLYQGGPRIFVCFEINLVQTQTLQKADICVVDAQKDDYSLS